MITAFPLSWPAGYERTPAHLQKESRFVNTLARARDELKNEMRKLGSTDLVISSNVPLKQNGDLRADFSRFKNDDSGVAIYFKWRGRDIAMACDQYLEVWENITALTKAIDAIRGLERWGVSEFLDRAFTGFQALPAAGETSEDVWTTLGITRTNDMAAVIAAYYAKSKIHHPDQGGDPHSFHQLTEAFKTAKQIIKQSIK
jgi:hypothetical protein